MSLCVLLPAARVCISHIFGGVQIHASIVFLSKTIVQPKISLVGHLWRYPTGARLGRVQGRHALPVRVQRLRLWSGFLGGETP